jgi:hypothetical protein
MDRKFIAPSAESQNSDPAALARPPPLPPWAESLTRWLDDAIRIPGTRIGIGLDALLGLLLPGLGDAATGVVSLGLLWVALQRRLPKVVLVRMLINLGVDALVGAVPILGDLFDVAWKANRKNLELIQRHEANPNAKPSASDYLLAAIGVVLVLVAIALPIGLALFAGSLLVHLGK